jgi:hypothetical protein
MKDILTNHYFFIGDVVTNIVDSRVCTTYPLEDFKSYSGQIRNNNIGSGKIINITPKFAPLKTILVEKDNMVIAVRIY